MKLHLAWIRKTAAAALVAGVGVTPAAAQYAPFRPIPQQPVAPKQAPVAAAPTTPYVAYRTQPAYQPVPAYPATAYQPAPTAYQPAPAARYQAPVTPVPPAAPATAYRQPVAPYPQTAMGQYPAAYGAQPYYVANQPTETLPSPAQPVTSAPVVESMPGTAMPVESMAPPAAAAPVGSGYAAAGCNCGATGGYSAGQYYGAAGCGCNAYPDCSGYIDDCGPENIWFGGVYFLYMDRYNDSKVRLTVEVPAGSVYPYHPPATTTVVNTSQVATDFRPGVEVRFGSTFTCGESCNSCNTCGSGYGYDACGCNSCAPSCAPSRMYAWEAAWWGIDDDEQSYMFQDTITTRIYGMKNFSGLEYDRDGAGATYAYRPVNDYYDYGLPIDPPPVPGAGDTIVLAQRVRSNFNAQNLELNVMRFPICDMCGPSCGGGGGCGYDACGCNSGCDPCGCEECYSGLSAYGSCGVRYFRTDDDFGYDVEFSTHDGVAYEQGGVYNGFTYNAGNELFWNIDIENNLIGPQFGWTTNYCCFCRWNFFLNSTFGVFNNHINQYQRVFSGGGGVVRFAAGPNQTMEIRNSKDALAFLGELRAGGSYDVTCHCRLVAAYRAVALTGVATSVGQFTNDFSSYEDVAYINSNQSIIVHGLQTGVECRY